MNVLNWGLKIEEMKFERYYMFAPEINTLYESLMNE